MAANDSKLRDKSQEFFIPDLCAVYSILLLVVVTELFVLIYVLVSTPQPVINWGQLSLLSLLLQWLVLLCAGTLCMLRQQLGKLVLYQAVAASLLVIGLITVLVSLAARQVLADIWPEISQPWWLWRNVLVALVMGAMVLRYFYLQDQLRRREQLALQSRLQALQARIRPHFLFNTMNSIASLIEIDPRKAEQVLEDFCELLRGSLTDHQTSVSLGDELRLCRYYLQIETLRLGERLRVDWQVDSAAQNLNIPSLILQPLVENAVHHGIAPLSEGGEICIHIAIENGSLYLEVGNPSSQEVALQSASSGYQLGLNNIHERLRVLYGRAAEMTVQADENYHKVVLRIPIKSAQTGFGESLS